MRFQTPQLCEEVIWRMRLADLPRGVNRSLINSLANGNPPWTNKEVETNRIQTNVNWLEFPKLCADARRSYYNAFLKPGVYFNVSLDYGPATRRLDWSKTITKEWNKILKGSVRYFEFLRSQFAATVVHGRAPALWPDREQWCPKAISIEDLLIPSNTLLTMENLNHFAVFRQYTVEELREKTHGPRVDPAWNVKLADAACKWADDQVCGNFAYSDLYSPEKVQERYKQDLGFYGTDSVPTVDVWDFYFLSDDGNERGWRRRMVLDTPVHDEVAGSYDRGSRKMPNKTKYGTDHDQWLYCPEEDRVYAPDITQVLHFQFGDASAIAPFKYHTVRSLGWLLYAVCHLQNRLRCKVNDALFESLLQYFRVANPNDAERITKLDLHNFGVVPEGVNFVRPEERWQINYQLVELGLLQNRQMMNESAAQYREGRDNATDKTEKTATQIMAEINAANALVGAMLMQAYQYHAYQGIEIARRFCVKNSSDPDVREFRANVLKAGVPEEMLDSKKWTIEPERVLGSGNKTLEIAMADKLLAARPLHDPESQREILHLYDMANSDNPDLADRLVPLTGPTLTQSHHDAQLMIGSLMAGVIMEPIKGQNTIEMIEGLIGGFGIVLQKYMMPNRVPTPDEAVGMKNIAATIEKYISILAGDKNEKERVRQYMADLGTLTKQMDTAVQRSAKAMQDQAAQGGNGGPNPQDVAKAQATILQAKTKAAMTELSHTQRTKQRDTQFQQKLIHEQQRHDADMAKKLRETEVNTAAEDLKTAAEIRRDGAKTKAEPEPAATE